MSPLFIIFAYFLIYIFQQESPITTKKYFLECTGQKAIKIYRVKFYRIYIYLYIHVFVRAKYTVQK